MTTSARHDKLTALRTRGLEPYPAHAYAPDAVKDVRARFGGLAPDTSTDVEVTIGGRIATLRNGGGVCFATLTHDGARIQVMLERQTLGQSHLDWKQLTDLGDLVTVSGEVITTKRGELTVRATSWLMASKALAQPPDKHDGITDTELLRRRPHLDLLSDGPRARVLRVRSAVMRSLRETLWGQDYLEVDTPVLQRVHGGAAARPFRTSSNALGTGLSLRIAPELYLKRLMVGNVARAFEIGPNFRNEGIDSRHSPEFMMLEAYCAWGDYRSMSELFRALVNNSAQAATGTTVVTARGQEFDLSDPWEWRTIHSLVSDALSAEVTTSTTLEEVVDLARARGLEVTSTTPGTAVVEVFDALVESTLVRPTFVTDWPAEVRPLARPHREDPLLSESWDLVVAGRETGTAYSELVDPTLQRTRLTEQSLLAATDPESMSLDEEFLTALESGMPPTGGLGLGIDRLVMLVAGVDSIRDSITFPLTR